MNTMIKKHTQHRIGPLRLCILTILILCSAYLHNSYSQVVFWSETFGNSGTCNQGNLANGFTTANGTWTVNNTGLNDPFANTFYISSTEVGFPAGSCRNSCLIDGTLNNQTLHVGNVAGSPSLSSLCPAGDCGAIYDAFSATGDQVRTSRRAESPVIDCSGKINIILDFTYIENGDSVLDNATVQYFDGSVWIPLFDPYKTNMTQCSGSGIWTDFSIILPASANNNPNVKIGFLWINNDDMTGTGPSFVVDDIKLSAFPPPTANFSASTATTICQNHCVNFNDMSINNPTSWAWSFPGSSTATSTLQNPINICYPNPGVFDVQLVASNVNGTDDTLKVGYITVSNCPIPTADFVSTATGVCDSCINFFDLSTPVTPQPYPVFGWHWYFPGASPSTSTQRNPTNICYSTDGLYDVILVADNGNGTDSLVRYSFVQIEHVPGATISPDTSMHVGDSYQLTASGGSYYHWTPALGLDSVNSATPIASPPNTTTYYCSITDSLDCHTVRKVTVTIIHLDRIFVPEAFSPNGDGRNDVLLIRGNNIFSARLAVFDRWGEKVFDSEDKTQGWDGTYKGEKLNSGVYTYFAAVVYDDGEKEVKKGTVALIW
jgi:gliding motility-associated-like protein